MIVSRVKTSDFSVSHSVLMLYPNLEDVQAIPWTSIRVQSTDWLSLPFPFVLMFYVRCEEIDMYWHTIASRKEQLQGRDFKGLGLIPCWL